MKAIVDCNSFYCSCEKVFRPDLVNKPIVVLSNNDGCIISRNDEAKNLGIQMAGPYYQARDMIQKNGVAVFSSNYNLYGDLSQRIMEILKTIAGEENVEVYSVDESFLNLSHVPKEQLKSFCISLKKIIEQWTGVAVSIGVASSKVLCKVANRLSKKDKKGTKGVVVLDTAEDIAAALQITPVDALWGVGRQYAVKLNTYQINTGWDLKNTNEEWARTHLGGVVGVRLIRELCGVPCIEMKDPLKVKKMITTTRMFGKPVTELVHLKEAVATYVSRAAEKLRRQYCSAKSVYVFVVNNDYETAYKYNPTTHGCNAVLPVATSLTNELIEHCLPLVDRLYKKGSHYLKAGVVFTSLVPDECIQGNLFNAFAKNSHHLLMSTIDNINFSMRNDAVKFVSSGLTRNWKMRQELRSPRYTSRWEELREVK
jgi:DNA polymerase V